MPPDQPEHSTPTQNSQSVTPYERAWTVPNPDGGEGAVLVACGREKDPYWWVLCPATATLYLSSDDSVGLDCNDGDSCDFAELHAEVHRVYRSLTLADQEVRP